MKEKINMSIGNKAKTIASILAVLLMSSVLMIAMPVQSAEAQLAAQQPVPGPLPAGVTVNVTVFTVAALSFRPNPIGVGQSLLVNFWTTPALPSNNFIHQGYTVTITKPDGTIDVRKMDSEPATAANWFEFVPDVAGNWTIKFEFAGEWFPKGQYYNGKIVTNSSGELYGGERSEGGSSYYQPSSTEAQPLTVQQDFVWSWPPAPLPTDYWTRPASLNNREWWPILGSWPSDGYQGYFTNKWNELYPDTNPDWRASRSIRRDW
jgi:hypothetical protein